MGCCFSSEKAKGAMRESKEPVEKTSQIAPAALPSSTGESEMAILEVSKGPHCPLLTYEELNVATEGFRRDHFLGEGGFGRVYKGVLNGTNQVAIKILNPKGKQGNREFCMEVLILSRLDHPNLVKLVGYCIDGDRRLLVYEYMPLGSLGSHLHDLSPDQKPLDWNTRMKILAGAAQGLQHLHVKADPPVINRDVKCENILLGEGYHPKLSDFGLAKLGPTGDGTHVSTRVMGTPGYCAPEYLASGQLTVKSDIYSFGVVMLEVITGRKAIDYCRSRAERNLVEWATPLINRKDFQQLADPALGDQCSMKSLFRALTVAQLCVNRTASQRPQITEVAEALAQISQSRSKSVPRSIHLKQAALSSPTWQKIADKSQEVQCKAK